MAFSVTRHGGGAASVCVRLRNGERIKAEPVRCRGCMYSAYRHCVHIYNSLFIIPLRDPFMPVCVMRMRVYNSRITLTVTHSCQDALVSCSEHVQVGAALDGGFLGGLLRSAFSGESLLVQTVEAAGGSGDALLCPQDVGDVELIELAGSEVLLQKGAFLASHTSIDVAPAAQLSVSRALFSGAGLFVLRATGYGTLVVNAHGGIVQYSLRAGESRAVDNGHLVAWDAAMPYELRLAAQRRSWLGSVLHSAGSGEGLMCVFRGPGRLWLQTHKMPEPAPRDGASTRSRPQGGSSTLTSCMVLLIFSLVLAIVLVALVLQVILISVNNWPVPLPVEMQGRLEEEEIIITWRTGCT